MVIKNLLYPKTTRDHSEPELKGALVRNSLPLVVWHRLNTKFLSKAALWKAVALVHKGSFIIEPVQLMPPQINYKFL